MHGSAAEVAAQFWQPTFGSGEVRDHIRGEKFAGLGIVPSIGFDQRVDSSVLVLPDQIDGLGHGATKPAQRSTGCQQRRVRS